MHAWPTERFSWCCVATLMCVCGLRRPTGPSDVVFGAARDQQRLRVEDHAAQMALFARRIDSSQVVTMLLCAERSSQPRRGLRLLPSRPGLADGVSSAAAVVIDMGRLEFVEQVSLRRVALGAWQQLSPTIAWRDVDLSCAGI